MNLKKFKNEINIKNLIRNKKKSWMWESKKKVKRIKKYLQIIINVNKPAFEIFSLKP
jgi:hypothetical protein